MRRLRKKWSRPAQRWNLERIEEERVLMKEYGLKNKRELWKTTSILKSFVDQAKKLIGKRTAQGERELKQLFAHLQQMGLIGQDATIDSILSLTKKDLLERRLQTILVKKKLAKSMKQARQFITHRHIAVGKNIVTSPSYLVSKNEEDAINFVSSSPLSKVDHPERVVGERR
ncbi:MAG: 30S ribosomal protein S4 [Candidatus Woesearchaeota archaeon]